MTNETTPNLDQPEPVENIEATAAEVEQAKRLEIERQNAAYLAMKAKARWTMYD
jgi:hypothetical protein